MVLLIQTVETSRNRALEWRGGRSTGNDVGLGLTHFERLSVSSGGDIHAVSALGKKIWKPVASRKSKQQEGMK